MVNDHTHNKSDSRSQRRTPRTHSPVLRTKVRRDLRRSRAQFGAVILTIMLGVALYGASADAYRNLVASYDQVFVDLHFADFTVNGGDVDSFVADAALLEGVNATATRTVIDPAVQAPDGTRFLGRMVGMPLDRQPTVNAVHIIDGEYLSSARPDAVLVEQHMADAFDVKVGDTISYFDATDAAWMDAPVAGIVASAEYLWPARDNQDPIPSSKDFGVVFAGEARVDRAAGPNAPRQALVYYDPGIAGSARDALDLRLGELAGTAGAANSFNRAQQPSSAALSTDINGLGQLAYMFPFLFLSAAGLSTYVLLTRLVQRQRPIIGTLAAIGFPRRTIFGHYINFGMIAGLSGAIPGAILGVVLGRLISGAYTSALAIPATVTRTYPDTILIGIVFGAVAGFLCAAAPALSASKMAPAEAMRGQTPTSAGRTSLAERLFPPLRRAPIRWRLIARGPGRNRRRTTSTVIGVVLSLTLILVSWGMLDTVQNMLDRQVAITTEDAQVTLDGTDYATVSDRITAVDGVAAVEPILDLPVSLQSSDGAVYPTTLTGYRADTEMHSFGDAGLGSRRLPGTGLVVGDALHKELGLAEGDSVTLTFAENGTATQAVIAGFVSEPIGTFAYANLDYVEDLSPGSAPNAAAIRYDAGSDTGELRNTISEIPGVVAYRDSGAAVDTMRNMMSLFVAFVATMLVFGALMAFSMIFATMSVNISERRNEVATLRAEGFRLTTIDRLIASENLILVALGIIPGLAIGTLAAWASTASYSTDQFAFPFRISPLTIVGSAVLIGLVAIVAQRPGLRGVGRIDVPAVLRERSY